MAKINKTISKVIINHNTPPAKTGPLTSDEQADYEALEKQANQGRNQPNAFEMRRLAGYRERLKGKPAEAEVIE
jgi:hypothetical protein